VTNEVTSGSPAGRSIYRGGRGPFAVVDTDDTAQHGFWATWANETWEPFGLSVLEAHCYERGPEGLVFDVGAWVGPYTLLAADYGCQVVAIEPDPVAYRGLVETLSRNYLLSRNVATLQKAVVGPTTWTSVELRRRGSWGDSMSSITREMNPGDDPTRMVEAISMQQLVELFGTPSLVKMDIEGGEASVLPFAGGFLRSLQPRVQLLLSLHPDWYGDAVEGAKLRAELENWEMELVEGSSFGNGTWLCRPKG